MIFNQKLIETKINDNIFKLLIIYFVQLIFYIILPNIIQFIDKSILDEVIKSFMIHSQTPLLYEQFVNEKYNWARTSNISIFLFFYNLIFYFVLLKFFSLFFDKFNSNNLDVDTKLAINVILVFAIFFVIKDNLILLDNLLNGNFERTFIYENFLSGRTTHINICIILSVLNFKYNKKIAYLGYLSILFYSVFSLSRVPMFYMFLLHIILNLELIKKNIKNILLVLILIFFIIAYRILFSLDQFNYINVVTDFFALHVNTFIFYENFIQIFKIDQFFINYIKENYFFLVKNLFYLDVVNFNFYETKYLRSLSVRGSDSVLSYFLCFLGLISFYYLFLILDKNKNNYLFIVLISYLSIIAFRGNFVHNLAFVLKFHILIILSAWIIKMLKLLKSKVV